MLFYANSEYPLLFTIFSIDILQFMTALAKTIRSFLPAITLYTTSYNRYFLVFLLYYSYYTSNILILSFLLLSLASLLIPLYVMFYLRYFCLFLIFLNLLPHQQHIYTFLSACCYL